MHASDLTLMCTLLWHCGCEQPTMKHQFSPLEMDVESNNIMFDECNDDNAKLTPFERTLRGIFLQHDPDRLRHIPRYVERYEGDPGKEARLLTRLEKKYMVTKTDLLLKGTEVDTTIPKRYNFYEGAMELLKGGSLNLFLIAAPVAFLSKYFHWYDSFTFCCALLAIAPFAERLGYITEQISLHTSDTVGGLLNATFGNATELIISIAALNKGYYRVVQLSLLGSVLSNLLLVLGSALFLGGLKYKYQKFNKMDSSVNSTLLVFAASATLLPTIIASSQQISVENGLTLSRVIAIIALMVYIAFLYFQISTHADMDDTPFLEDTKKILQKIIGAKVLSLSKIRDGGSGSGGSSSSGKMVKLSEDRMKSMKQGRVGEGGDTDDELLVKGGHQNDVLHNGIDRGDDDDSLDDISQFSNDDSDLEDNDDDEDDEEDVLGVTYSIFWLAVVTIFISVLSDIVVDTIEVAALDLKVPKLFIAAIIVPIIGNAAEHASAIVFAMKNKLNITLGVAVGSSCQISLMVLPLLVTIGWAVDRPMSMNLGAFEGMSLFMSILVVVVALKDGISNWLVGLILILTYTFLGAAFWLHTPETTM